MCLSACEDSQTGRRVCFGDIAGSYRMPMGFMPLARAEGLHPPDVRCRGLRPFQNAGRQEAMRPAEMPVSLALYSDAQAHVCTHALRIATCRRQMHAPYHMGNKSCTREAWRLEAALPRPHGPRSRFPVLSLRASRFLMLFQDISLAATFPPPHSPRRTLEHSSSKAFVQSPQASQSPKQYPVFTALLTP